MKSNSYSDLHYFRFEEVVIVIDRPTGRWCSLNQTDMPFTLHQDKGPLDDVCGFEGSPVATELRNHLLVDEKSMRDQRGLEYLLIKCTSACNYSCTYCYDHDDLTKASNLDAAGVKEKISEALSICRSHLTLLFHGGEPLLRLRFMREIADFARTEATSAKKTIIFKMQTHGGMFSDEAIEFLTEYRFFVGISLDGPAAINDQHRLSKSGEGTYGNFYRAYEEYGDFMRSSCGVITTPTNATAEHLLSVARHFRDLGFQAWRTTNYLAIGRVQENWTFEATTRRLTAAAAALADGVEAGEFDDFRIGNLMTMLGNLLADERPDMCTPGNNACGAGRRFLSIEADGTLLPCDTLPRSEYSLGHISSTSLHAALKNRRSTVIAESLPRQSCVQCPLLGVCGGTCLGLSSLTENRATLCMSYKQIYPDLMRRLHFSDRLLKYFDRCNDLESTQLDFVELESMYGN